MPITVSPGLQEREVDGEVRGRARVRLHVGVVGAEQRLRAVDAELLDLVDVLLALVVALARVALAVLVGEDRAGGGEHRARDVVLRGDQPDRIALAALFLGDQLGDFGVDGGDHLGEGGVHARFIPRYNVAVYTPSREEFVAAPTRGNLIPVYRELLADGDTPVSAYAALGAGEHSFLLESVVGGATWAAYSFVGVAPRAVVTWAAGHGDRHLVRRRRRRPAADRRVGDGRSDRGARRGARRDAARSTSPGLPRFWGGAVGWIALRLRARVRGPARARGQSPAIELPPLCMVLTDTLLIFDNLRQTLKVVATPYVARPERAERRTTARARGSTRSSTRCARRAGRCRRSSRRAPGERHAPPCRRRRSPARPSSPRSIASRSTSSPATRSRSCCRSASRSPPRGARPLDVYRALRVINPSPYMFHLEFPEARVTGASPETLVRLVGRPRRGPADRRHPAARRDHRRGRAPRRRAASPIPRSAPST